MHVSRLHFKNWGPFKGDHVLLLEPTFYAVTARLENDRERSNFLGKTSLLEAIRFALFGEHRHRLEDSWITDGEADGLVGIELDARFSILRKRVRGKSTKFQAFEYGEKEAVGDEAGDLIERWLGLGEEDFDACHLAQGRASAFVTGDSSWRTERVIAWCGIEKLERCRDATRADALERELGELRAMASTAFERWQRALAGSSSVEELEQKAGACEAQFAGVKARLGEALAEQAEGAKNARAAHAASEYERVVKIGKDIRERLESKGFQDLLAKKEKAAGEEQFLTEQLGSLRMDREKKRVLARGEFSGTCPIAGIECPAHVTIRGMAWEHAEEFRQLDHSVGIFEKDLELTRRARARVEEELRLIEGESGRLGGLRQLARELREAAGEAGSRARTTPEELSDRIAELMKAEEYVALAAREYRAAAKEAREAAAEIEDLRKKIDELEAKLKIERAAAAIFGRFGAQRRVASAALSDIERRANDLLQKAGVEVHVGLEWEREGKDPAKECPICGWGYPPSRQVRSCGACGEPRGLNLVRQLNAVLSRSSGAANDLAGLAIAFGAYGWLRAEREARWSVAMLDECFAQVDKAHRRSVAGRVRGMMTEAGYDQGFVVSHDASTTGALPGRIEVVSDGRFAKVEVIA